MTDLKTRSRVIDRVRGVAILLVMLGHTMTGSTAQAQGTFVFRVVWSLQMPLFFLISGYVTRYLKPLPNPAALLRQLGRRTLQLMLPFTVWTFLVRGLLFGQTQLLRVGWLTRHMDSAYWFLFSLWVISIGYHCAVFLSGKLAPKRRSVGAAVLFCAFLALLAAVAIWQGSDFLGGKLTLYYAVFYLVGALFGAASEKISLPRRGVYAGAAVCLAVWVVLLLCFDYYAAVDDLPHIALRALSSLLGCAGVFGVASALNRRDSESLPRLALLWIGRHTLELYLVHYLCLNLIRITPPPACASLCGAGLIALNLCLTLALSVLVAVVLSQSLITRLVFYGKLEKKVVAHE